MYSDKLVERFWSKVEQGEEDECWEWRGAKLRNGYGVMAVGGGRNKYAHRMSYELSRGKIEGRMQVCHACDNPPCVNPNHLFLGTAKDNAQDMVEKGRHLPSIMERREATARRLVVMKNEFLNGATVEEIAEKHGIAPKSVTIYLGSFIADVSRRQRGYRNKRIVADYKTGQYSMAGLGEKYALDVAYIHRIIHGALAGEEIQQIVDQNRGKIRRPA